MKIYSSAKELIGNTPLVRLKKIETAFSLKATLLAKLEYFNLTGSAKDRIALSMIEAAEKNGQLKDGSVIIEPTSGNTGIGLAAIASLKGYKTVIVMPDTMSKERIALMRAYGAEVVTSDGAYGMSGAIKKAEELAKITPGSFIPSQFENPANPLAHYLGTGREIYSDTDGKVDIFVAGVGTGGTVSGVGKYLKEQNPLVKIVAVEPRSSAVISTGVAGKHRIQGIGAGFIPKTLDTGVIDEILPVDDKDAFRAVGTLGKTEGIFVGISSGAALFAAITVAKRQENEGKTVVVLLPDSGDRYLSSELFDE